MQSAHRALLLGLFSLPFLAACDVGSESGTSFGTSSVSSTQPVDTSGSGGATGSGGGFGGAAAGPTGSKDTVVPTVSVPGTVSVTAGASQTVSVTFTSSDGLPMSGLAISSTTLPSDWSGTQNYNCTLIGKGSSCVLNLTYAPTAAESGSLDITYIYINNAGQPITPGGTVTIPYVATAANNIAAAAAPTGQVIAALDSGAQSVSVNFTTDDGNAGTNLALTTDLSSLPAGWSSTATNFTCAIVSTGNGCELILNYAPTAAATGTLTLNYTYSDDTGAARTGALNIPYSTTTDGTVVATTAPAGQVTAVEKTGSQAVTVIFTTDDGKAASNLLLLSDLTKLPAGWTSSSNTFSCGSVSTGNGCQLTLNYAPTAIASGTVSLNYSYLDAGGTYNVGSFNIAYAATTNDNVVGTAAPSGQITDIVGSATSPTVMVTFATDDGRPATALELTTSLTSLPGGWSSTDSTFTCSGVNGGTTCQLPLTFTPTAAESGTLNLAYKYVNDAGEAKTGSVNIPYRATTNNEVDATFSPNALSVLTGSTTPVTVTFVTDDGNPATDLTVTSGLTPLPAGWSSAATTFTCSSVSTGTGCQLSLSYAPTAAAGGMLTLAYSYTNNSGIAKTGTIALGYTASVPPPPTP
jgi:hypothetical protein